MALFTTENAADMAARAHEARRKADEKRELILAQPPQIAVELVKDGIQQRLERTRKQVELVDELIDSCDDAEVLDQLTRSKERLFKIWARLAQIPTDPKPVQQRATTQRRELPPPTVAQAQPSSPQANQDAGQAGPSNP